MLENRIDTLSNVYDVNVIVDELNKDIDNKDLRIKLLRKVMKKVVAGGGEALLMCKIIDLRLLW